MQTENEPYLIEHNGWTVRVRPPLNPDIPPRAMLLLHGWTGDERVMWIFTTRLPENLWLLAPRAPIQAGAGYGWLPREESWAALDNFIEPAQALMAAVDEWGQQTGAPVGAFDIMGFSQGAAMAYVLGALYPQRVDRVLALAGFLPRDDQSRYAAFRDKPVYIAHGSRDDIVPVRMAEEAVRVLESHGASVTYCASDVGHKMSSECLKGIEAFLERY